ncbi:hypothetical protein PG997_004344 [Apiospora hydei]|uniref:Vps72/YL1 C-terminal domain-containing protein n=1 Tax=Apiospora hydei TaxID=1337664 RepID=A0ABR1X1S2_9PEZI
MATEEGNQRMSLDQNEDADSLDSSSEDGDAPEATETEEQPVEWLATSRAKRSTAGNRMQSMLAVEEPDDELELLFAEDGEDGGFTDVDEDASDVQMDSSSDDDDAHENADEDEGEKELARQARESKQAARKRKAQEAIPLKFRKKQGTAASADVGARGETSQAGRRNGAQGQEDGGPQKPPMTQAERLAEAALVEKRNAKSLNRWEEAEKQREAERRAKLAALNNRQLSGPVVTFWSGVGEWVDGKLKYVGKIVTIEEKPAKKKRTSTAGVDLPAEPPSKDEEGKEAGQKAEPEVPVQTTETDQVPVAETGPESAEPKEKPAPAEKEIFDLPIARLPSQPKDEQPFRPKDLPQHPQEPQPLQNPDSPDPKVTADEIEHRDQARPSSEKPMQSKPAELKAPDIKPPDMKSQEPGVYTTSMFAPPSQLPVMKPPEMKPPTNSFLAPPQGPHKVGYLCQCWAIPPRQSPLAAPQPDTRPSLAPPAASAPTPPQPQAAQKPSALKAPTPHAPPPPTKTPSSSKPVPSHTGRSKGHAQKEKASPPPRPPTPPPNGKATRNCILLQNFNENAISQKAVQTRILFGKEMQKLAKPGPAPRCVITNHLARYRDPETGLPYYNSYAYKQIQKLKHGDYKWSQLVGAWVGSGSLAATGVPARFLDPTAPAPPKVEAEQPAVSGGKKPEEASRGKPGETAPVTPVTPVTPTGATPSNPFWGGSGQYSYTSSPATQPATKTQAQAESSNHPAPPAPVTEKIIPVAEHSATKDANSEVVSVSSSANAPVGPGLVHSVASPVGAATSDAFKTSPTSTPVPVSTSARETTQEGEALSSKSTAQTTTAVQP